MYSLHRKLFVALQNAAFANITHFSIVHYFVKIYMYLKKRKLHYYPVKRILVILHDILKHQQRIYRITVFNKKFGI